MTHNTQYTASIKRTVSQSTEALITAKCQLSDLHSLISEAMGLIYEAEQSNKCDDEIYKALTPIRDLVDRYIIRSIDEHTLYKDSTEF